MIVRLTSIVNNEKKSDMGEIRSTLDIIMEKTKGLRASEDEKEAFRQKELRGKVQGLVQKYLDGLLSAEAVQSAMTSESKQEQGDMENSIKEALLRRLGVDPDNDQINTKVLAFLSNGLKMDNTPYLRLIEDSQREVSEEKTARIKALKHQLAQRGISGTALLPNLVLDPTWPSFLERAQKAFQENLLRRNRNNLK